LLKFAMQLARLPAGNWLDNLVPATKRQIAVRMLRNLEHSYTRSGDRASARRIGSFLKQHLPPGIPFNDL
jgi:hypothetical protein